MADDVPCARHPDVDAAAAAVLKAASLGSAKLLRIVTEGGADVHTVDARGQGALATAIVSERLGDGVVREWMVGYLLGRGVDADAADRLGQTPLIHACRLGVGRRIVGELLRHGADPLRRDSHGKNSVEYAGEHDDPAVMSLLVTPRQVATPAGRDGACPPCPERSGPPGGERATGRRGAAERRRCFQRKSASLQDTPSYLVHDESDLLENRKQTPKKRTLIHCHTVESMTESSTELFSKLERTTDHQEQAEVLESVLSTLMQQERQIWRRDADVDVAAADDCFAGERRRASETGQNVHSSSSASAAEALARQHSRTASVDNVRRCHSPGASEPDVGGISTDLGDMSTCDTTTGDTSASQSATKDARCSVRNRLLDDLSITRPGQLPALNVNLAKPIPDISTADLPAHGDL